MRHWASPMGMVPRPRSPKAVRSNDGPGRGRPVGGPVRGPGRAWCGRRALPRGRRADRLAPPLAPARQPAPGELVGDHRGVDVGQLAHGGGDPVGGGVVEHPLPAGGEAAAGQQDGQLGLAVGHRLGGQLEGGPGQAAVVALHPRRGGAGPGRAGSSRPRASADSLSSMAKWTARSSSGWRVRAYWRARAVAMSRRSTSTITVWRLSTGASAASAAPCLELLLLVDVLAVEADEPEVHERADHHHHPGPLLELDRGEDEDDEGGEDGGEAVDSHPSAPVVRPCCRGGA